MVVSTLIGIGTAAGIGGGGAAAGIAGGVIVAASAASFATTIASSVGAFDPNIPKPQVTPAAVIVDQQQELQRRAAGIGKAGRAGTVLTSGRGLADDTLVASRPRLLGESTGRPAR